MGIWGWGLGGSLAGDGGRRDGVGAEAAGMMLEPGAGVGEGKWLKWVSVGL